MVENDLIKIGFISKAYGFKGDLKFKLEVHSKSVIFHDFVWIYINGKPVHYFIESTNNKKNSLLIKLENVDDEETALKLKNSSIFCEKKIFNTFFEKEESLDDLIDFSVEDLLKGNIGFVDTILKNTIQPTLVLMFQEKEILIPYTDDIIKEIDMENKSIIIEAPEGLIEMYLS